MTRAKRAMGRGARSVNGGLGANLLGLALVVGGCGLTEADKPLTTSLHDLAIQSDAKTGKWLKHVRVTSLSGLSPINRPGAVYHYPPSKYWFGIGSPLPVNTAVGIGRRQSYELIGQLEAPGKEQIDAVNKQLAAVQAAASDAVAKTLRAAEQKARVEGFAKATRERRALAELEALGKRHTWSEAAAKAGTSAESLAALKEVSKEATERAEKLARDPDAPTAEVQKLEQLEKSRDEAEKTLALATKALRDAVDAAPGVIIITWDTKRDSGTNVTVGSRAGLESKRSKKQLGFAVIAGFRVRHMYFGADFKRLMATLQPEDRAMISEVSLPTYLLQTQHVRYQSQVDLAQQVRSYLEVKASDFQNPQSILTDIDRIRLASYVDAVANLANMGNMTGMRWGARPMDVADPKWEAYDLNELRDRRESGAMMSAPDDRQAPLRTMIESDDQYRGLSSVPSTREPAKDFNDDWMTLDAVVTSMGGLSTYGATRMRSLAIELPLLTPALAHWATASDSPPNESGSVTPGAIARLNAEAIVPLNAIFEVDATFRTRDMVRDAVEAMGASLERLNALAKNPGQASCSVERLLDALLDLRDAAQGARAAAGDTLFDPDAGLWGNEESILAHLAYVKMHADDVALCIEETMRGNGAQATDSTPAADPATKPAASEGAGSP